MVREHALRLKDDHILTQPLVIRKCSAKRRAIWGFYCPKVQSIGTLPTMYMRTHPRQKETEQIIIFFCLKKTKKPAQKWMYKKNKGPKKKKKPKKRKGKAEAVWQSTTCGEEAWRQQSQNQKNGLDLELAG